MRRKFISDQEWFFEDTFRLGEPTSSAFGLLPLNNVYAGKSPFQDIEIFDTEEYGRVLVLDGIIQLSTKYEFVYHEMLTHPAALCHGNPKRVLIVGGGDGGSLREVLKYPVKEVVLIDIDPKVIDVSKQYLSSVSTGAFGSNKLTIINDDAFTRIAEYRNDFDLIISDCTDAYGPSESLWGQKFFGLVLNALKNDGVASFQTGFFKEKFARDAGRAIRDIFPFTSLHRAYVACFPFDECTFVVASQSIDCESVSSDTLVDRYARYQLENDYYSPSIHKASAVLPRYLYEK
ncbi:hypothetical protein QUF70_09965 [Desulfobacterales bacterium HSG17]|nr:hypothetical protein [Desulfobacterales bacterium HSG17]